MAADPSPSAGSNSGAIPPPPHWWTGASGGVEAGAAEAGAAEAGVGEASDPLFSPHQQTWKRDSLLQELSACRDELASMRALLNDLPQIFESKFETRLQPLLEQKQRLLEGNQGLREQLSQLNPAADPVVGQLMPAADPPLAPSSRRQAWGRSLRHAFGLGDRQRL